MPAADFVNRPHCPACGTQGKPVFARAYADENLRQALVRFYANVGRLDYRWIEDAGYAISACPCCRSWFQTSVPSDAILGLLYEKWIDPEMARERFHRAHPPEHTQRYAGEVGLCLHHIANDAPRTALDYGCGWGEWGLMTRAYGLEAWGTELSASRCKHAMANGIKIVPENELPDSHFGMINLDQVLEHMPAPETCMRLLAAKLHPGGLLRVAVPNPWRVASALKRFDHELNRPRLGGLNAIAPLEHLNAFTHEGLLQVARRAGLVQVKPRWSSMLCTTNLAPGMQATAKALLRPFYLRSRYTTQVYFRPSDDTR